MTIGNALSAVFEWGTICAALVGVVVITSWLINGVAMLWRRARVRHELTQVEKLSLEALARYRRDLKL